MGIYEIKMPEDVRYMSEAQNLIFSRTPLFGKYILDKTLTGCGGTELFLNSDRPLVLISPRSGMLYNKSQQHPECHLFRSSDKENLSELKDKLRNYIDTHIQGFNGERKILKILVTLDSAKYVIEELNFRNIINNFLFLVDEFQCLISDAAYKGQTDLEFLKLLDKSAQNICYMSATPIDGTYLSALEEFKNCDYYKLEWNPNVVVEPTVKKIYMQKGETPVSIFSEIIKFYRQNGYFAKKQINGKEYRSEEAVVFVNEVKTIRQIIEKNNLQPSETTILISESNKFVKDLERMGFRIGTQNTDRNNPKNKTFTFCSKASFEGRDFYSNNAFTYIFLDGTKDWQTHDTSIEIPQMLGRQRLDSNPFKYNAVIYYRTKPCTETHQQFHDKMREKMEESQAYMSAYDNPDPKLQKAMARVIMGRDPNNPYMANYLDVVADSTGYRLEINYLVAAAEHNLWLNKAYFYNNPWHLTTAIQTQFAMNGTKPQELRDFEEAFNKAQNCNDKMRCYSEFLCQYPQYNETLRQNPFIDFEYHMFFDLIGPQRLAQLNYDMIVIEQEITDFEIKKRCAASFSKQIFYQAEDVKSILQEIYDSLGYQRRAKASQISQYLNVKTTNKRMPDGSRQVVYNVI